ncbi:hypothetical protein KIN20_030049 [Parelaphostrongylus tenuis]|uniref:Uncharacterized protein n=1 Tax=Parelaphostrongylus tenuis TaxID=148309 RepID=A0AAD5R3A8_PARTN|nr:hypothetical protein KIN20_030049 [Parelaphostrongylus tenuis]
MANYHIDTYFAMPNMLYLLKCWREAPYDALVNFDIIDDYAFSLSLMACPLISTELRIIFVPIGTPINTSVSLGWAHGGEVLRRLCSSTLLVLNILQLEAQAI